MERLTYREENKAYTDSTVSSTLCYAETNDKLFPYKPDHDIFSGEAIDRLASYEDTGLTPEEIPHWIAVSDRLPDPKDKRHIQVLVIQKSTITGRPNIMSVARWNGADWVCRGVELARVTHWMPLPVPPKEENDA